MLSDQFLEKFFSYPEIREIPVGTQAILVDVFEDVLIAMQEEEFCTAVYQLLEKPMI